MHARSGCFIFNNNILLLSIHIHIQRFTFIFISSHPEVFLREVVLKICSKFTGDHPCRIVISIKLQSIFIEIALRHGCSPVNLVYIFRTPFPTNTSGWLRLYIQRFTFARVIRLSDAAKAK